jgi:hypothetical protein
MAGGRKVAALALATGFIGGMPMVSFAQTAPAAVVTAVDPAVFEGFWKINADPDASAELGGRLEFEEYFIIESGVVTAQELSKLGFAPTLATFSNDVDGSAKWTVTMSSRSQGDITLTGKLASGRLTGTLVWVKADGNTYTYAYAGSTFTPGSE